MTSTRFGDNGVAIERLDVSAYTVPTDFPESDGTSTWEKTTIVIVEATVGESPTQTALRRVARHVE
jgi:hypothetical protein